MVNITKEGEDIIFEIEGWHKLWSLKSRLRIPASHISKVYKDEEQSVFIWGLRLPGTQIPGVISAGTFIVKDGIIFCDITDAKKAIIVELHDEHYKKLIIDVHDVEKSIALLKT